MIRELDHAALMRHVHPDRTVGLKPTHSANRFHDVLGSDEFEAVLLDKWHVSSDLVSVYNNRLLERLDNIELLLSENLAKQ